MIFEKQIIALYKKMAFTRCDDTGTVFYYSAKDFPGLDCRPYTFHSSLGHRLQGYIYCYQNPIPSRLIVFDHGFGGGHSAYMKEIERLCRHGYTVFAYDHTGCMASEGESPNGLAQSLHDLDDCITALAADPVFGGYDISVMGHSWGGFSTLNIAALHPHISHVVVLSGFVSVQMLINSYFSGILKGYRKTILSLEEQANPKYIPFDATRSLRNTKAKVLLIYSDNDKKCPKTPHYDTLHAALSNQPNIRFMLVSGKGHNPNYTADAVAYMDAFFKELTLKNKKKALQTPQQKAEFVASFDWERMTAQDDTAWEAVFETLDQI